MAAPITPRLGADTFVLNDRNEVCLIRRADNGLWAMPGGYQDMGETPAECAVREFFEETGYEIRISRLLGVFSSLRYRVRSDVNRGRDVAHILFQGILIGGAVTTSNETLGIGWFPEDGLPPLSDGHHSRLVHAFRSSRISNPIPHFE